MIEARVTSASTLRRLRINSLEIIKYGPDGSVETVEVQAVKADLHPRSRKMVVIGSQPTNKIQHVSVAPHPGRKTFETSERLNRVRVTAYAVNISTNTIHVRPISFRCDRGKASLLYSSLCDSSALTIKLVRPVRSFTD